MRNTIPVGGDHGTRWAPQTRSGRLSVALAAASLAGLVAMAVSFAVGLVESVETFSDSWLLVTWGGAVLGAGLAAVVAGLVAARHGERSVSVTAATVVGVLMTLLVLNEVAQGL
jgi:hypothetical protein